MASRSGNRQAGGRLPREAQTYRSADAERLGHTAIRLVKIAFGTDNCDPAVAGMVVITGVVKQSQRALRRQYEQTFDGKMEHARWVERVEPTNGSTSLGPLASPPC